MRQRLQYKFLEAGNSGVQFRSAARPEGDRQRVYGYQYEMRPGGDSVGRCVTALEYQRVDVGCA